MSCSSLVMCLCRAPSGIVGIAATDEDDADKEVCVTFDDNVGGNRGLQGECELAEVLADEAANGTPDVEYKS